MKNHIMLWIKVIRLHQWSKNALLFLPLLMSHKFFEIDLVVKLIMAFFSFGLCASAGYIINDISDIEADKKHLNKQKRPFASGRVSTKSGKRIIPILLLGSLLLAYNFVSTPFTVVLIIYFISTMFYTLYLKEKIFIDVIVLGALYTLRVLAGGLAVNIEVSTWLMGFSWFFFLSLAIMKRYADLVQIKNNNEIKLSGRGYLVVDKNIVQQAGIASGFIAMLVLVLYINSTNVINLYHTPILVWLAIPFLLYWLVRMWIITNRGEISIDPVIFALCDKRTYIVISCIVLILILAARCDIEFINSSTNVK